MANLAMNLVLPFPSGLSGQHDLFLNLDWLASILQNISLLRMLSEEELELWVKSVSEKEALRDSEEQWLEKVKDGQSSITWQQFK